MPHIGELLKQARKKKGLTQAEAAAKVGVSQGVLSQHESGSDMRVTTLISYCKVYGIKQIPVSKLTQ